jgi:hypothetical protein
MTTLVTTSRRYGYALWIKTIAVLVNLWVFGSLCAQTRSDSVLYAGEFLRIPSGARACGMGDADVSLYLGPQSILTNPAVISSEKNIAVSVEGAVLFGLSRQAVISLLAPVGPDISVGIAYAPFFSGDIVYSDSLSETYSRRLSDPSLRADESVSSVFRNNQHEIVVGGSRVFRFNPDRSVSLASFPLPMTLSVGGVFKGYWETLDPLGVVHMGFGVNADAGARATVGLDYDLTTKSVSRSVNLALSLRNIVPSPMKWVNSPAGYTEPIYLDQNYGISYEDKSGLLHADWIVSLALKRGFGDMLSENSADSTARYSTTVHGGLEALFFKTAGFRIGFSNSVFTLGAAIVYKNLRLDYALRFDDLAISPIRMSLQYSL